MRIVLVAAAALLLTACGGGKGGKGDDGSPPSAHADPFASQPDTGEGLVNVGTLEAVLENGTLPGACERYEADPTDRRKRLECGKFLFFYGTFDTLGAPKAFVDYLLKWFPDEIGPGFSKLGMVPDPYSADGYPLGMTQTRNINGAVPAMAFTCASCHFGQLPDGRYAVGYGNHRYAYGQQILDLVTFPVVALNRPGRTNGSHDLDAVALVQPLLDKYDATPAMQIELAAVVAVTVPFALNFKLPTAEQEGQYVRMKAGVQDFFIPPTAYDDGVFTLHKMQALWGVPTIAEAAGAGMANGLLGFTGNTHSLEHFLELFVYLGGGVREDWPRERLQPLADYIHSLRAPSNPSPPPADAVARGRDLFVDKGCIDCHDGPRGSGKRVYAFEEVGVEDSLRLWLDGPDADGHACCGVEETAEDGLTGGIKSPRLVGLWAMTRFLHNGSIASLEDLFCVSGPRPTLPDGPGSDRGHDFTCDGLGAADKSDLIAYLKAH